MIKRATFRTGEPACNPLNQRIDINRQLDHMIKAAPMFGKQIIKDRCLCFGARIAIENHTG